MLTGDFPVLPRSGRSPKERSLYLGGKTMNKTELIAAVAEKAELSKKDAEKAVKAFTDAVAEELVKGGKVQLVGFGTFEVAERAAREGRNPKTGKTMTIEASRTPKFKAASLMSLQFFPMPTASAMTITPRKTGSAMSFRTVLMSLLMDCAPAGRTAASRTDKV